MVAICATPIGLGLVELGRNALGLTVRHACSGDHSVKVAHVSDERYSRSLVGHQRTPWAVAFHPRNPDILATGSLDKSVRIWNHRTNRCIACAELRNAVTALTFSPSGDELLIASGSKVCPFRMAPRCQHFFRKRFQGLPSCMYSLGARQLQLITNRSLCFQTACHSLITRMGAVLSGGMRVWYRLVTNTPGGKKS